MVENAGKVTRVIYALTKEVDGGQFGGKGGDVHAPELAQQPAVVVDAQSGAQPVVGTDEESAGAAGGVQHGVIGVPHAESDDEIHQRLWGKVLAQGVTIFRWDEPLKDGTYHVLGQVGEVAGVQVAHQVTQLGGGSGREGQAIHHVLAEHGVVVNFVRRREAIPQAGEYLTSVQATQVHGWQMRRSPAQTLVKDDLAQQTVNGLANDSLNEIVRA